MLNLFQILVVRVGLQSFAIEGINLMKQIQSSSFLLDKWEVLIMEILINIICILNQDYSTLSLE